MQRYDFVPEQIFVFRNSVCVQGHPPREPGPAAAAAKETDADEAVAEDAEVVADDADTAGSSAPAGEQCDAAGPGSRS